MWFCWSHGSRNPKSNKFLVHNPSQKGWDFFVKRIEFLLTRILNAKECVCYNTNTKAKVPSYYICKKSKKEGSYERRNRATAYELGRRKKAV